MAQIVGIFGSNETVNDVIEQLHLNDITEVTLLGPDSDEQALTTQCQSFGVPDGQIAEYQRRLHDQRWLLFVQVNALSLPTVQRALRNGAAMDIDILPDSPM